MEFRITRLRSFSLVLVSWIVASLTPCAQAALVGRLPATPGGSDYQAYYDTVLDITWLANANLAQSNTFGVGPINGNATSNPGAMGWGTASTYVAAANAAAYLGFSTWRLPTVAPLDGVSFDLVPKNDGSADRGYNVGAPGTEFAGSTASPLAHLYYTTLGNIAYYDTSGVLNPCAVAYPFCLTETGPFSNVMALTYWIGTPYDLNPNAAWAFNFGRGEQNAFGTQLGSHVWLVLDGDVDAVGKCGDANEDTLITAPDALSALRTAVGLQTCAFCRCDTDNSGGVTASDALTILRYAVGLPITLNCPTCG
jgi:hypothetical protein